MAIAVIGPMTAPAIHAWLLRLVAVFSESVVFVGRAVEGGEGVLVVGAQDVEILAGMLVEVLVGVVLESKVEEDLEDVEE
jgi:hypothetical protein